MTGRERQTQTRPQRFGAVIPGRRRKKLSARPRQPKEITFSKIDRMAIIRLPLEPRPPFVHISSAVITSAAPPKLLRESDEPAARAIRKA